MSEYETFKKLIARYGFIACEMTQAGFAELRDAGYTIDDCYSVECDLQAGFTISESIAAMGETAE